MNSVLRASTASLLIVLVSFMSIMTGCKSAEPTPPQSQTAAPVQNAPASAPSPQMSVDDLVAPVALYPDQLLAQILTASTNVQEVLDGGNWLLQNQHLKGAALSNAAKQAGFIPSMQYLMSFPQVVDNMCQQIDWTRQLGQSFQADQKGVMDAVQRKRAQAQQAGNLKSSPQLTIETKKSDNNQPYVEIKPADPQIVYVPQYNPVTIYNTPAPATVVVTQPAATTTTVASSGVSPGSAVAIGIISFGVGMAIGASMRSSNYYPYPAWGYGGIYYGGRPYYPPLYRPVYPGYRPAYGYHPPPNYHWNQYNKNINVNVNNNYYGKFNSTIVNNINANNRPAASTGNQGSGQANWKGQSTYQGARPNNPNPMLGTATSNANSTNRPSGSNNAVTANRPNVNNSAAAANRPNAGNNAAANRTNPASSPGANSMNRNNAVNAAPTNRPNATKPGTMNQAVAPPSNMNRGGDRGYSIGPARPDGGTARAARPAPPIQSSGRANNSVFTNSGSAKSERTASSRGQASMGAGSGSRNR